MRITNNMMVSSFLTNINSNMTAMDKYQYQLSTGNRIRYLSDDPIGVMSSMDNKTKLRKLDMQNASISDAQSWLSQTESSLDEANGIISQLYDNAVSASNGTMTDDDKKATAQLVEQMRQQVVQIGNSTYGDRYIFGGYNTTSSPFAIDSSTGALLYNGVDLTTAAPAQTDALKAQVIRYSTGTNVLTDVSINGVELMGTGANNLVKVISDFETALNSGADSDALGQFVDKFQTKQQDILSLLADVGGRTNRLNMMQSANSDDEANYTQALSNVADVDQAQATMDFKMAEAVYRSALEVGAQVIQPTLMDFLK
jgi:flagellar hook-associated protein 3 FlgL